MKSIFMLFLIGIYVTGLLLLALMDLLWGSILTMKIQIPLLKFSIRTRYLLRCVVETCKGVWQHFKTTLNLLRFKGHSKTHQW